jgi:predicted oxidoreductase
MSEEPDYSLCPACPEIKKKIDRIDLALMGSDGTGMKEGIVKAITELQKNNKVQASWVSFSKPLAIAILSSIITFGLTYGLLHGSLIFLLR